jgi:hypothetical protein
MAKAKELHLLSSRIMIQLRKLLLKTVVTWVVAIYNSLEPQPSKKQNEAAGNQDRRNWVLNQKVVKQSSWAICHGKPQKKI